MSFFLDLFNGNPATSGVSVLSAITGSATRPDVTSQMVQWNPPPTFATTYLQNPATITVAAAAAKGTNVNFVALYDSASGGSLQFSAPIGAHFFVQAPPTVSEGYLVQFLPLALSFLVGPAGEMVSEAGIAMITEAGIIMITEH